MNEFKILLHSYKVLFQQIIDTGDYNPITESLWKRSSVKEMFFIFPNILFFKMLTRTCESIGTNLKHSNKLSDYIQLTRFFEHDNLDRLNCDWCSIVNGFNEFLIESIKNNRAEDIIKINNSWFDIIFKMLVSLENTKGSVVDSSFRIKKSQAIEFIVANNIRTQDCNYHQAVATIEKILNFRNLIAQIESRWCPFKYLSDIEYEREYWGTNVEHIAKTLQEKGRIVCTDCIKELNQVHENKDCKPSVFQPFLEKLERLSSC